MSSCYCPRLGTQQSRYSFLAWSVALIPCDTLPARLRGDFLEEPSLLSLSLSGEALDGNSVVWLSLSTAPPVQ